MARTPTLKVDLQRLDALPRGRHATGLPGLYVDASSGAARSWVVRLHQGGKEIWMTLARTSDMSLGEALTAAEAAKRAVRAGRNPVVERKQARQEQERAGRTVAEALAAMRAAKMPGLSPSTTRSMVVRHRQVEAELGDLPLALLTPERVAAFLQKHWLRAPATAAKLRGALASVWDFSAALRWVDGGLRNPAAWEGGLQHVLPRLPREKPQRALGWIEVPDFWRVLEGRDGVASVALRFTILTGARTGEVLGAEWSEIRLDAEGGPVWVVPGPRMKMRIEHATPLVPQAVALLRQMEQVKRGRFVFCGADATKPLSNMSMLALLNRVGWRSRTSVHGFRSAMRSFMADSGVASEVAESCIAHQADRVTRAYQRSALLDARRAALEVWAQHVVGAPPAAAPAAPAAAESAAPAADNVVTLAARRRRPG